MPPSLKKKFNGKNNFANIVNGMHVRIEIVSAYDGDFTFLTMPTATENLCLFLDFRS